MSLFCYLCFSSVFFVILKFLILSVRFYLLSIDFFHAFLKVIFWGSAHSKLIDSCACSYLAELMDCRWLGIMFDAFDHYGRSICLTNVVLAFVATISILIFACVMCPKPAFFFVNKFMCLFWLIKLLICISMNLRT